MNATLLPAAERSETTATLDQILGGNFRGVMLVLDVTATPSDGIEDLEAAVEAAEEAVEEAEEGTEKEEAEAALEAAEAALAAAEEGAEGTLTVSLEGRDPASGEYVTLTAFTATKKASEISGGDTLAYTVYPGAVETTALTGHEVMGLPVPTRWRAVVTHSAGGPWTYSLGVCALH